jgi:hypothetical protein
MEISWDLYKLEFKNTNLGGTTGVYISCPIVIGQGIFLFFATIKLNALNKRGNSIVDMIYLLMDSRGMKNFRPFLFFLKNKKTFTKH